MPCKAKTTLEMSTSWQTFRYFLLFFAARGRGRGSLRRREGAGRFAFYSKIPRGGLPGGGGGFEGVGGRLREIGGGGAIFFFRGRNSHQDFMLVFNGIFGVSLKNSLAKPK